MPAKKKMPERGIWPTGNYVVRRGESLASNAALRYQRPEREGALFAPC